MGNTSKQSQLPTACGSGAEDMRVLAKRFSCPLYATVSSYHECQSICIDELFTTFGVLFSAPTESLLEKNISCPAALGNESYQADGKCQYKYLRRC